MKKIIWTNFCFMLFVSLLSAFSLYAADADGPPDAAVQEESDPDGDSAGVEPRRDEEPADQNNPGLHWLEQAIEEKLKATGPKDFSRTIALAQRARREGLSGENLKFCDEFIASEQLQRGMFLSQQFVEQPQGGKLPQGWNIARIRILSDLESAVKVIKDQPLAYLRIAQLNLLLEGDAKRAAEALALAEQTSKNDPGMFAQVMLMKARLEKDPQKRERMIAEASETVSDARIQLLHAMSQIELNHFDQALETLKEVLQKEPENVHALASTFDVLVKQKKYEEAEKVLDALEEQVPSDQLTIQRARLYVSMGKKDEAIALMDELREKNPEDAAILGLRATMFHEMKEYEKALQDVDAALRIVPKQIPLLLLKSQIFIARNRSDEAAALLWEIYEDNPEKEDFAFLAIQACLAGKDFAKASEFAEKIRSKNPENPRWTVLAAQLLMERQQGDKAVKLLEDYCNKKPDDTDVRLALVVTLSTMKKSRKGLEYLAPLLEKNPNDINLLRIRGQLLLAVNLHVEAVQTLEKVVEAAPDDEVSVNNLSWLLSTSPIDMVRNGKRALELAEKACKLTDYKKAYILSTLAAAYAELGDFDEAIKWSQKSIDLSQEDKETENRTEELNKELESYKKKQPYREAITEESE